MQSPENNLQSGLKPYLSSRAAWALAIGTSIGWGSFVITSNTYLSQAGPLGSILGIVIGAVIMLIIGRNFHYMANLYPDAGGVYSYTKNAFGYDRGFLSAWFLILTYIAMFWANATSLPLFARYFLGDTFRFGYLYSLFGYDVYLGEALLSMAVIALIALLCIKSKRGTAYLMIGLAFVFVIGIVICFAAAIFQIPGGFRSFEPAFVPDNNALSQVLLIACISPWAFVGFESISHSTEEFSFPRRRMFRILTIVVISTTLLYAFVTLLSVTAYPEGYDSWLSYIRDFGNIPGIMGLPAFYAANHYLGSFGVILLFLALLALIVTSLIGNLVALSRLLFSLSKDKVIPSRFSSLNKKRIPAKAILLVTLISLAVPFLGRTTVGWIVDVTTICALIIYGFVSAAAFKTARKNRSKPETVTGLIGLILMLALGVYLLLSDLFSSASMETETYILFIIWAVLGFIYFRWIIAKDHARHFGKAIIVWVVLLALVVFMAMVWMGKVEQEGTDKSIQAIQSYYDGSADPAVYEQGPDAFIKQERDNLRNTNTITTFAVIGLFALSLGVMLSNYQSMRKWEEEAKRERDAARAIAFTDPLTGVKSKHSFVEKERELDSLIEQKSSEHFAVVVCDVNGLKYINDTLGHQAGDQYICAASMLICEHFKHSPVFRIGGDEFAVILDGQDYHNRTKILKKLNQEIESNVGTTNVVISLGVSDYLPEEDTTFRAVFERADALMYHRKQELKGMGAITRD